MRSHLLLYCKALAKRINQDGPLAPTTIEQIAMETTPHPVAGVDYPRNWHELLAWFPDDAACLRYLERLRWGDGFACRFCGAVDGGWWQMGDGLRRCRACRCETSVTAGTILAGMRTPLVTSAEHTCETDRIDGRPFGRAGRLRILIAKGRWSMRSPAGAALLSAAACRAARSPAPSSVQRSSVVAIPVRSLRRPTLRRQAAQRSPGRRLCCRRWQNGRSTT
ncbi:MAG: transposase [Solirubrobacterales bacterium]|nr:transposase [Solirubrobacterales bacterium]